MGKCSAIKCNEDSVQCIKQWTDSDGKILEVFCLEHEEEVHKGFPV